MAIDDLYLLVFRFSVGPQPMINRFYYRQSDTLGDAESLAIAFKEDVMPDIQDLMHQDANLNSIDVVNVDSPGNTHVEVISLAGSVTGEKQKDFFCVAFQLEPVSPLVGVGRKAIGPISEADVNGEVLVGTAVTRANTLATSLAATIAPAASPTETFVPSLFSEANLTHVGIDLVTDIASAAFKRLSTQNSRKGY